MTCKNENEKVGIAELLIEIIEKMNCKSVKESWANILPDKVTCISYQAGLMRKEEEGIVNPYDPAPLHSSRHCILMKLPNVMRGDFDNDDVDEVMEWFNTSPRKERVKIKVVNHDEHGRCFKIWKYKDPPNLHFDSEKEYFDWVDSFFG